VGYKKVGKTTLIEKLVPELSSRGYRVATVKHHHSDFPVSVDRAGTDTWTSGWRSKRRFGDANGYRHVPRQREFNLFGSIVSTLGATDIVLGEGFHEQPLAKIEVLSDRNDERLCKTDGNLLAIVAPTSRESAVPTFEPTGIKPLADLIERNILTQT